jgi:hypothetical protein
MRLSLAAIVGMLLGLALVLPSCGEDRSTAAGERTTIAAPTAQPRGACHSQLHRFLATMDSLRDKLARGLSYDEYLREVKTLRAAYRALDARKLPLGCLLASGAPGERAYNLHIDAVNRWGDCLATISCDTVSIEPKLQRKWALASAQLSNAQQGLRH